MSEKIPHWLSKQAYLAPNRVAIENEQGETTTFSELKEAGQNFAKKLAQSGVIEGDHVGVLSNNNTSMVIAIHALSYLGAVSVLLNTRLTNKELTYQINDAEIYFVLVDNLTKKGDMKHISAFPHVKTFSEINQVSKKHSITLRSEINLDEVFTIIYTSGTTGFPKGVIHTYGNHLWSAIGSALNLGLDKDDKWLAVLPTFHVGGLSIFIKSVVYGMPVYLVEKFDPQIVNQAIIKHGVTIASVVTLMLQKLVQDLQGQHYPEAFRCMLLGGGPAPKSLLELTKQQRIPVFQSYGMTETSSQIVTLSPEDALSKLGSAGKPLFSAQLKISNQDKDSIGEINVKGPMVTRGYFNDEKATRAVFQHNWLATGDLGYLDKTGFLYVVDRRTDLIISGGENIYPTEIENVLASMDSIFEVGVTAKIDKTWGEVPVAFVVKNSQVTTNEIIHYAEKHLANYKIPKQVFFVDHLPRNASNKLVRSELQKMIEKM